MQSKCSETALESLWNRWSNAVTTNWNKMSGNSLRNCSETALLAHNHLITRNATKRTNGNWLRSCSESALKVLWKWWATYRASNERANHRARAKIAVEMHWNWNWPLVKPSVTSWKANDTCKEHVTEYKRQQSRITLQLSSSETVVSSLPNFLVTHLSTYQILFLLFPSKIAANLVLHPIPIVAHISIQSLPV